MNELRNRLYHFKEQRMAAYNNIVVYQKLGILWIPVLALWCASWVAMCFVNLDRWRGISDDDMTFLFKGNIVFFLMVYCCVALLIATVFPVFYGGPI